MALAEASPTVGSLKADILLFNPAISKYHVKNGKWIIKLNGKRNNGKGLILKPCVGNLK